MGSARTPSSRIPRAAINTAVGLTALAANTSGNSNTASGAGTLQANTIGVSNTAVGVDALNANTEGNNNVAIGFNALTNNLGSGGAGSGNTAIGNGALVSNTLGNNNIAIGQGAGSTNNSGSNGSDSIYIGNITNSLGIMLQNESSTMRIGDNTHQSHTFIGGISNSTVTGLAVVVDTSGHLGVAPSSRRLKYDIQDMDRATKKLLQLRPVTFRYTQAQNNESHPLQSGLIAEEVADVYPELVQYSAEGQPNAVFYQFLPAMLLNEFQKEHKQVAAQQEQIQSLQDQLAQLAAQTRQLQTEITTLKAQGEQASKIAALTPRQ